MKRIVMASVLVLAAAALAQAGSRYDACIKKEKALKAKEASDCSGLRYLLDPSSCFRAQRELKEFAGTCAAIAADQEQPAPAPPAAPTAAPAGATQRVPQPSPPVPPTPAPQPAVTAVPPAQPTTPAVPAVTPSGSSVTAVPVAAPKAAGPTPEQPPVAAPQPPAGQTCEQIREENARLRAELEQLRKAVPR